MARNDALSAGETDQHTFQFSPSIGEAGRTFFLLSLFAKRRSGSVPQIEGHETRVGKAHRAALPASSRISATRYSSTAAR